ncbi:MAG: N-acetyltransferase [Fermentimonas sp.]|nr:N-acetyltransferase [Fermentimonas sp.]
MEIQKRLDDNKGSFFIEKDGRQVAELDFIISENVLDAIHTGVRSELEGQGIAGRLFDEMVKFAREKGYKVKPSCPYIDVKFKRDPEGFKDVVY